MLRLCLCRIMHSTGTRDWWDSVLTTCDWACTQILDNAVISAGILDDVREMLPRLSQLMKAALEK